MHSTARQILQLACDDAEARDGGKSKKYAGAMAGERLKEALLERGIPVSDRNVFIEGVCTSEGEYMQIDYIIPLPGENVSAHIYQPQQVLLALEVKKCGFFDSNGVPKLRKNFDRFRDRNVNAACAVLRASKTYPGEASDETLGYPCFTFLRGSGPVDKLEDTGDLERLVAYIRAMHKN